jgi:hypothetical protein
LSKYDTYIRVSVETGPATGREEMGDETGAKREGKAGSRKKGDAHHASAVQPMTRLAMDLSASGSAGREADMAMSFLTRSAGSEEDVGWSGVVMVGQSAALGDGGMGKKR